MNIETLKVFRDIVETGSFSKAAEMNYVSQSAVSQQMKKMEILHKTRFLSRTSSKIRTTRAGKVFYEASKKILEIYAAALEDVSKFCRSDENDEIKISAIYSAGIHILEKFVEEFAKISPRAKIKIEYKKYSDVLEDITLSKSDFGIVAGKAGGGHGNGNLRFARICREEMVVITGPGDPLSAGDSVRLKDLEGKNFVSFTENLPSRKIIDGWFKKRGVRIKNTVELDNVETIKTFVKSGRGVAIIPRFCVSNGEKNIKRLTIGDFRASRPVMLVYLGKRKMPAAHREFADFVRKADVFSGKENE